MVLLICAAVSFTLSHVLLAMQALKLLPPEVRIGPRALYGWPTLSSLLVVGAAWLRFGSSLTVLVGLLLFAVVAAPVTWGMVALVAAAVRRMSRPRGTAD